MNLTDQVVYVVTMTEGGALCSVHATHESAEQWCNEEQRISCWGVVNNPPANARSPE